MKHKYDRVRLLSILGLITGALVTMLTSCVMQGTSRPNTLDSTTPSIVSTTALSSSASPTPHTTAISKPTPTFYATLYPYSLDSLSGWSVYTDTQLNISFPYPAQHPRAYYSEEKQSTALVILANWDSTDPRAVAVVQMVTWENPDSLSIDSFIAEIARNTGNPESYRKVAAPNPELTDALKHAGAEDVVVYQSLGEPEYFASYQGRLYSFGQGFESSSSAQNHIFELIVRNVKFLP